MKHGHFAVRQQYCGSSLRRRNRRTRLQHTASLFFVIATWNVNAPLHSKHSSVLSLRTCTASSTDAGGGPSGRGAGGARSTNGSGGSQRGYPGTSTEGGGQVTNQNFSRAPSNQPHAADNGFDLEEQRRRRQRRYSSVLEGNNTGTTTGPGSRGTQDESARNSVRSYGDAETRWYNRDSPNRQYRARDEYDGRWSGDIGRVRPTSTMSSPNGEGLSAIGAFPLSSMTDVEEEVRGPNQGVAGAGGSASFRDTTPRWPTASPPPTAIPGNRRPINYQFPLSPAITEDVGRETDAKGEYRPRPRPTPGTYDPYASPRRDLLTRYMSARGGRIKVTISASMIGMGLGSFIGKSTMGRSIPAALIGALLFILMSFTRGDSGELSRALGLALILLTQRTRRIRRQYPTKNHLKALVRAGPRKSFPPIVGRPGEDSFNDNPWAYKPYYEDDVEFRMTAALIAMAFVGTVCGGNLPLIPTWLGALAGAAILGYATTIRDSRGDLARTMGMRLVVLLEEFWEINSDLLVLSKLRACGGKLVDRALILDRKHRIRDKVAASLQWAYGRVATLASQVQADMQGRGSGGSAMGADGGGVGDVASEARDER